MLTDANDVPRGASIACDVCVIGAGAAGITVAHELAGSGRSVCVLESGGLEPDPAVQSLYRGTIEPGYLPADHDYLTSSRLRYFGGTTNHWMGVCGPLAAIDFEDRPWVPNSGWPIDREELDPWYRRACETVEISPLDARPGDRVPFAFGPGLETEVRFLSPPTRFGRKYRDALATARDVDVLLGANAVDLRLDETRSRLGLVRAATLGGNRFEVRPGACVLAAGGIENARLLLNANDDVPAGLGNRHDLVGRYFMDHLYRYRHAAVVVLAVGDASLALYESFDWDEGLGHGTWGRCTLSAEVQRRHRLPHHGIVLTRLEDPERVPLLGPVAALAGEMSPEGFRAPAYVGSVGIDLEMTPAAENRITLGEDRDELGLRRAVLHWNLTAEDRDSAVRYLEIFVRELGHALRGRGSVRLRPDFEWSRLQYNAHHLGTTRMHRDPERGVVDPSCRVHDVANLFVAGSSVFPTSGQVNPTLTIVALAHRLAHRLKEVR